MNGVSKLLVIAALTWTSTSALAAAGDVKGSKDNALLKRYEGSTIAYYDRKEYAEFKFLSAPLPRNPEKEEVQAKTVEGAYTRLVYIIPEGRSTLEVVRNYQDELRSKNGKIAYECKDLQCGPIEVGQYIYPESRIPGEINAVPKVILGSHHKIADQHYTVVTLPESGTYVSILSYVLTDTTWHETLLRGKTVAIVDIVEPKAREQKMVTVEATQMASAITATGKVALYGLYFDSNKADVKPESDTTLVQIAKLLRDNTALRLLVVGHTDNVGGFSANMELSQRRAAAIASSLTGRYGVGRDRLLPVGVSFASPVAPNANEEGRSKNRRVELVENASLTR